MEDHPIASDLSSQEKDHSQKQLAHVLSVVVLALVLVLVGPDQNLDIH